MRWLTFAACLLIACGEGVRLHPELLQALDGGADSGSAHSDDDAGVAGDGDARPHHRPDAGSPLRDAGPEKYDLTISIAGDGKGKVQTSGSASCDSESEPCSVKIDPDAHLTLEAEPDHWSEFDGWDGVCKGASGDTCNLVMRASAAVTARFVPRTTLTASVTGPGRIRGDVIDCSHDAHPVCKAVFAPKTMLVLTAEHDDGANFAGWTGDCAGSQLQCTLTMDGSKTIGANFLPYYTLNVLFLPGNCTAQGSGSVSGRPEAFTCVSDQGKATAESSCSTRVLSGTDITLTATATLPGKFSSWSEACAGNELTCTLRVTSDVTVGATFCNDQPVGRVTLPP